MDLELNDIQQELASTLNKYLRTEYDIAKREEILRSEEGISREKWQAFAEMGLLGLAIPESYGGADMTFNEVAVDPVTGKRHRYLSEIIEVGLGEGDRRVAVTHVFMPDARGRAVPVHEPTFMNDLVAAGFDRSLFGIQDGLWDEVRR